jgi:hypothetical protein
VDGGGGVSAWNNLTELAEITHADVSEGAWAAGDPTGNTTVGIATCTDSYITLSALVLKPSAGAGEVTGTLATTEGSDVAAFSGGVGTVGTLATTEVADTVAITGTVSWVAITGTLSTTEASDVALFASGLLTSGILGVSELADVTALSGTVYISATLAVTEVADGAYFTAGVGVDANQVFSITFWKGIDTASPVRSSDGVNGVGWPQNTALLSIVSGDKVIAFAGFKYSGGDGSGDVTSWNNVNELAETTHQGYAEGAWATGNLPNDRRVGVQSCTGSEGGIAAIVIKTA